MSINIAHDGENKDKKTGLCHLFRHNPAFLTILNQSGNLDRCKVVFTPCFKSILEVILLHVDAVVLDSTRNFLFHTGKVLEGGEVLYTTEVNYY